MPMRSFALKTIALLAAVMLLPAARAATGIATNVVLTVTTPSTISYGEVVAGYAVVSASDGSTLSGTVSFFDGAANICTIPVTQTTSCPPSAGTGFAVGIHMVTVVYSGDGGHLGSTSNAVPVVVVPDVTTVSLASSSSPAATGESVTFTVTVKASTPAGSVIFMDGSTQLGTAMLNDSGTAAFSTAALGPGSHSISAKYTGSASATASSSALLVETIGDSTSTGDAPFTLTLIGTPAVVTGGTVNLTVTVAPQTGSIGPVALSCSGLPSESACTFGTATLPDNGGTTSLEISTMAPHGCAADVASSGSAGVPFTGTALAGLLLLLLPRRSRWSLKGLFVIVAACGIAALSGCGNCTDLGTRPGDYTIKIIGTSTSSAASTVVRKIVLHVTLP